MVGNLGGDMMGDNVIGRTIVGGVSGCVGSVAAEGILGKGFKLDKFPGGNAVAGLHDAWGRYDWLYDKIPYGISTSINAIGAVSIVYSAFYTDYYHVLQAH